MVRPRPSSPPPGPEPVGLGGKPRRRCPHPHAAAWAGRSSRRPRRRPAGAGRRGTVDLSRREAIPVTYPASTWATEENTWPSSPSSRARGLSRRPDSPWPGSTAPGYAGETHTTPHTGEASGQVPPPGPRNGPQPLHPGGKTPVKRDLTHDRLHGLAPKRPVPQRRLPQWPAAAPRPNTVESRSNTNEAIISLFSPPEGPKGGKGTAYPGPPAPLWPGRRTGSLYTSASPLGSRGLREA